MTDWLELRVEVAARDAELVADILQQRCSGGVAIEHPGRPWAHDGQGGDAAQPETAIVRAFSPPDQTASAIGRSLKLALRFAPLTTAPIWRRSRRIREQAWQESWKRHFHPLRIGRRIVIKPSWIAKSPGRPGDIVIELDPGMAFGTGQHPTTALCLQALENEIKAGDRVLDLGTGTGILAIAAAKLGASRVLALDIDPQAVRAAQNNVAANGAFPIVEVAEGTLESHVPKHKWDVVVANISGEAIERRLPDLAGALAISGTFIASGFLEDSTSALSDLAVSCGLAVKETPADGDWRAIVAKKTLA